MEEVTPETPKTNKALMKAVPSELGSNPFTSFALGILLETIAQLWLVERSVCVNEHCTVEILHSMCARRASQDCEVLCLY